MVLRHIFLAVALFSLGGMERAFAVGTPKVSGSIMRDTSITYFDIAITVTDISKPTLNAAKEKSLFKDRLRVWMTDLATGTTDYIPFEGDAENASVPFTLIQRDEIAQTTNSNSLTDFVFYVRIAESASGSGRLKKTIDDYGYVKLKIKYYEDLSEVSSLDSTTISRDTAIVQDAPTGLSGKGTHKAIVSSWTVPSTVTWSDSSSKAPTSVTAIVIDKTTTSTNLPAYIYNKTSTSGTDSEADDGTCTFDPDFADGSSCVSCSDTNAYLNPTKLEDLETLGIFSATATASQGKVTVSGLENSKNYAVLLFYQPGGLSRTTCVTVAPEANQTLAELNGEKDAELMDPKCFIATAAYGSRLHKNLRPLRWFRDHVLLRTKIGTDFVDWYYTYGPRGARVVAAHPTLQVLVQGLLWGPVVISSAWMYLSGSDALQSGSDPQLSVTILTLIAAGLIAMVYIALKTREDA